MAKNKRPRRPYSKQRVNAAALQNLVFEHREIWGKEVKSHFDSGALGQIVTNRPNESVCRLAVQIRRRWYLVVTAWCLDSNGNQYVREQPLATAPCLLDELREHYIHHRDALEAGSNPNHLITLGWVARPLTPQLERRLQQKEHAA